MKILKQLGFELVEAGGGAYWQCRTTGVRIDAVRASMIFCQADVLGLIYEAGRVVGQRQQWHACRDAVEKLAQNF